METHRRDLCEYRLEKALKRINGRISCFEQAKLADTVFAGEIEQANSNFGKDVFC